MQHIVTSHTCTWIIVLKMPLLSPLQVVMTIEKDGRPTSPVHVHVDDATPVHVHVKKPKKSGYGSKAHEVGKMYQS